MSLCEVVEVRSLVDRLGYPCTKTTAHQCWDCGIAICKGHAEMCSTCKEMFCPSCLEFHQAMHAKRATANHRKPLERRAA
jgi:hypothetical protein